MTQYIKSSDLKKLIQYYPEILKKSIGVEILASIIAEKREYDHIRQDLMIGFVLRSEFDNVKIEEQKVTLEKIKEMLEKSIEKDTLVDFTIIKKISLNDPLPKGLNFQVKQIGNVNWVGDTANIIKYLNQKILGQYPKTTEHLLLVLTPQIHVPIDFNFIYQSIKAKQWPFLSIRFLGTSGADEGMKILYGEFYPNFTCEELPVSKL